MHRQERPSSGGRAGKKGNQTRGGAPARGRSGRARRRNDASIRNISHASADDAREPRTPSGPNAAFSHSSCRLRKNHALKRHAPHTGPRIHVSKRRALHADTRIHLVGRPRTCFTHRACITGARRLIGLAKQRAQSRRLGRWPTVLLHRRDNGRLVGRAEAVDIREDFPRYPSARDFMRHARFVLHAFPYIVQKRGGIDDFPRKAQAALKVQDICHARRIEQMSHSVAAERAVGLKLVDAR